MEALALISELLAEDKLVIKVQTFPFKHAAEAYRLSQGGHVRGKLVLVPLTRPTVPSPGKGCRIIECPSVQQPRL